MRIITDEDVPDSVGRYLSSRGHQVLLAREHFLPATPDSVIAKAASEQEATVFTFNRRHFRRLGKRRRKDGRLSYPGMSVVSFTCSHPLALERIQQVIEEVEAMHHLRVLVRKTRLLMEVGATVIRVED